ncbi:metalloregulator ArsR/SmtB family transcription factor [Ruegeria pomeroyi]|nr:metalloregulator ArsR/SmtB family transcription factor [Ruegeria pomeroyi]
MDILFKALNDPARRAILDQLRQKDGQSLSELESKFDMTRFGVMKHLKLLEEAHLVLTRREGRFKYHYLNPLPLQDMISRWVAPFLQPQAQGLAALKDKLETENRMGKPDFMMQTFIRCTQDALWAALTETDQMAAYHFLCNEVQGKVSPGETVEFITPAGGAMLRQVTRKLDPKSRIEMSFEPLFMGPGAVASEMVYLIETQGEICKLTIEHYNLAAGQEGVGEGWARLAASLKSYLETGTALKGAA